MNIYEYRCIGIGITCLSEKNDDLVWEKMRENMYASNMYAHLCMNLKMMI